HGVPARAATRLLICDFALREHSDEGASADLIPSTRHARVECCAGFALGNASRTPNAGPPICTHERV
ncbi:MAG TPA: hypothetical protein VFE99_08915, partial [Agromyces sp.]|nr:hypothetical protein [Agromyces sp.]